MSGPSVELHLGDCVEWLRTVPDASVDAVVTDPPYPEIDRPYGRLTEDEWWSLIVNGVIPEVRRILKTTGSAVFILQPNSRKVGSMRGWLFEFQAWACREWNMVQDAWWWNHGMAPTVHCQRRHGLMRPSVKACVWLGAEDCFRDQGAVLWAESDANRAKRLSSKCTNDLERRPSSMTMRARRCVEVAEQRGGTTPFNLLPVANSDSQSSAGANGHGAGTAYPVASWWTRYLCPSGGTICDPFAGTGTMALAAIEHGCHFIGAERDPAYHAIALRRINDAMHGRTKPAATAIKPTAGQLSLFPVEDVA